MVNVKLPKTVRLKTYVGTTLVLTVLLLASVGYVLTSNGTTVTITPQSYTETASYVIFKVGSTYYAKNGSTGEIEFSGTNASYIVNQALSLGKHILIKSGQYNIAPPIQYISSASSHESIVIEGEGFNTELGWSGGASTDSLISVNGTWVHLIIKNIRIYGGDDACDYGITAEVRSVYLQNVMVSAFKVWAILLQDTYDVHIEHCYGINSGGGLYLKHCNHVVIEGGGYGSNHLDTGEKIGIKIGESGGYICSAVLIQGVDTTANDVYGIYVNYGRYVTIKACYFENNGQHIALGSGQYSVKAENNYFADGTAFLLKNSGTIEFNNNSSVTISHGLAKIPTFVSVSFNITGWGDWKWSATLTQLTITTSNTINATAYWYAEYKP